MKILLKNGSGPAYAIDANIIQSTVIASTSPFLDAQIQYHMY